MTELAIAPSTKIGGLNTYIIQLPQVPKRYNEGKKGDSLVKNAETAVGARMCKRSETGVQMRKRRVAHFLEP